VRTAGVKLEEDGDDVESSWPLRLGLHGPESVRPQTQTGEPLARPL